MFYGLPYIQIWYNVERYALHFQKYMIYQYLLAQKIWGNKLFNVTDQYWGLEIVTKMEATIELEPAWAETLLILWCQCNWALSMKM